MAERSNQQQQAAAPAPPAPAPASCPTLQPATSQALQQQQAQQEGKALEKGQSEAVALMPARGPAVPQPHGGALRPFLPGHSGNPSGRPKGYTPPSVQLRQCLDMSEDELVAIVNDRSKPMGLRNAARLVLDGHLPDSEQRRRAVETAMDRMEGRPAQRIVTVDLTPPDPEDVLNRIRRLIPGGDEQDAPDAPDATP